MLSKWELYQLNEKTVMREGRSLRMAAVAVLLAVVVSAAEGKVDGVLGRVRKGVRENEVVGGLLEQRRGGRWWLSNPNGKGSETRVRENEVESVWVRSEMV